MTLKEALEDLIAHPRKRALRWNSDLIYFDDTWDKTGFITTRYGSFGFGFPIFSVNDVRSDAHEVVDTDLAPYTRENIDDE